MCTLTFVTTAVRFPRREIRQFDNSHLTITTANGYAEDALFFFSVKHVKRLNTELEKVLKMDHLGLIFSGP